jgi:hypothetical protein
VFVMGRHTEVERCDEGDEVPVQLPAHPLLDLWVDGVCDLGPILDRGRGYILLFLLRGNCSWRLVCVSREERHASGPRTTAVSEGVRFQCAGKA